MSDHNASPHPESNSEPLTRGHKKRARTRQELVNAALRLFARQDVAATALQELAAEADVSTGTIYNYFRTREELAEAAGIALASSFSEHVDQLSAGVSSGSERLAIGIRLFVRQAHLDPQWANALVRVIHYDRAMHSKIAGNVLNDLRGGFAEGTLRYSDEGLALDLIVSVVNGAIRAVIEGRTVPDDDSKVAEMILRALGATAAKAKKIATLPLPLNG